jgi:hypothetical protein
VENVDRRAGVATSCLFVYITNALRFTPETANPTAAKKARLAMKILNKRCDTVDSSGRESLKAEKKEEVPDVLAMRRCSIGDTSPATESRACGGDPQESGQS